MRLFYVFQNHLEVQSDILRQTREFDNSGILTFNLIEYLSLKCVVKEFLWFPLSFLNDVINYWILVFWNFSQKKSELQKKIIMISVLGNLRSSFFKSFLYRKFFECVTSSISSELRGNLNIYMPYENQVWEKVFQNTFSQYRSDVCITLCQHAIQRRVDFRYKVDRLNRLIRDRLFYGSVTFRYVFINSEDYDEMVVDDACKEHVPPWRYSNSYQVEFSKKGDMLFMGCDSICFDITILSQLLPSYKRNIYYKIHPSNFDAADLKKDKRFGRFLLP